MTESVTITHLRQLDALVAERVMGIDVIYEVGNYYYKTENGGAWVYQYSTDIAAAWQVVEKLASSDLVVEIRHNVKGKFRLTGVNTWRETKQLEKLIVDSSCSIAICLAALRSVGVEAVFAEGVRL